MKNTILIAAISIILATFGCKKESSTDANQNNNGNSGTQYDLNVTSVLFSVSDSDAVLQGNIYDAGGSIVDVRGICLGQTADPAIDNSDTTLLGSGTGTFEHRYSNLVRGITYHFRAFGINHGGIYYGNDNSFILNANPPTVRTSAISGITQIFASSGGEVTSDGGSPVTSRGIVFSKTPNPVYYGPGQGAIQCGSGTGVFSANMDSLWANTVYYVRAYAVNALGTSYGEELTFTTLSSPFSIGQTYQGGKIFFIDYTGLHGLICAANDQGVNAYAPPGTQYLHATGSGQYNTNLLVGLFGASAYAAGLCNSLTLGGYDDWYLPSIGELVYVYNQRALIGGFNGPDFTYWSSTDDYYYPTDAKAVTFITGEVIIEPKNSSHRVRAIRAF